MLFAMWMVIFMVQTALAAANVVRYVEHGYGVSLFAAIFCGVMALSSLVMAVVNVR